ncbi:MAG: hypothetical protein IPK82_19670 [Polyangiaceae bacterium]|nr:hypothetical protein [Polyangiaceae bacterium]
MRVVFRPHVQSAPNPVMRPFWIALSCFALSTAAAAQPAKPTASATATAAPTATSAPVATSAPDATASPAGAPNAPSVPNTPSPQDRARAKTLMDEGDEKLDAKDLEGALAAYQAADAIMHVPTTGIEVAKTLSKLGRVYPAYEAMKAVATSQAVEGEPEPFVEAREEAKKLISALEARVPTLRVTVKLAVPGAAVTVAVGDRKFTLAELANPVLLPPGKYRVLATAEGHAASSVDVELRESDRGQVALVLAKLNEPPPLPTVTALPPPPPSLSPLVPAGFAIAGVGLLTGAITGALALSQANQANNNLCPLGKCPNEETRKQAESLYNTADALAVVADISFVVAAVGAVMGVYGISVSIGSPPAPGAASPAKQAKRPTLILGPTGGAVRFQF